VAELKIGLEFGDGFHRAWGVGNLTANDKLRVAIDHLAQPFAKERMVIHDEDAALFRLGFGHGGEVESLNRYIVESLLRDYRRGRSVFVLDVQLVLLRPFARDRDKETGNIG